MDRRGMETMFSLSQIYQLAGAGKGGIKLFNTKSKNCLGPIPGAAAVAAGIDDVTNLKCPNSSSRFFRLV